MKKLLISFLLTVSILFCFSQVGTFKYYRVTNAGGTVTVPVNEFPNTMYVYCSSGVTLAANYALNISALPPVGSRAKLIIDLTNLDFNGHTVSLFGWTVSEEQATYLQYYEYTVIKDHSGGAIGVYNFAPLLIDYDNPQQIYGNSIIDGTLPLSALDSDIPLSSFDTVGRGRILLGNSTNALSSYYAAGSGKILVGDGSDLKTVSVSGDISLTTTGVTYIDSATIRDSSIATGAAIKWQKLATGTASYVAVTNASGVLTTEQYLQPIRGGTGINTNASTGFATVSAGTWSVGSLTDVRDLHVSFAASSQGTYYITFPVAVTVTNIEARVETALAATDSATLQIQNDAGTNMTGDNLTSGLLVMAASATTGTGYTSTLTTNNTFTAGQRMRIITNKGTAGGTANIQVTYTRNN